MTKNQIDGCSVVFKAVDIIDEAKPPKYFSLNPADPEDTYLSELIDSWESPLETPEEVARSVFHRYSVDKRRLERADLGSCGTIAISYEPPFNLYFEPINPPDEDIEVDTNPHRLLPLDDDERRRFETRLCDILQEYRTHPNPSEYHPTFIE